MINFETLPATIAYGQWRVQLQSAMQSEDQLTRLDASGKIGMCNRMLKKSIDAVKTLRRCYQLDDAITPTN